jgi:hypothetical protein
MGALLRLEISEPYFPENGNSKFHKNMGDSLQINTASYTEGLESSARLL